MAQIFLDGLPQVTLEGLTAESKCMICLNEYGTEIEEDSVENAVRLPCGHDVGAKCIQTWLSPDKEARNSCPACRMTFFPAQPRPYMEHSEIEEVGEEDEEDDWHGSRGRASIPLWPSLGAFFRGVLCIVGEAGQPPQEGQILQRDAREEIVRDRIRSWWLEFFATTTEQYNESIRRARAVVTTPRIPPPGADMDLWSPYPYLQISGSEPINPEEIYPQYLDKVIRTLATAFRTLSFREALIYSVLRVSGAEARLPAPADDHLRPLNAEQEEALFREMERRGAFPEVDFGRQYFGLTNRERWQSYREEGGESWNPGTRLWSPDWSDLSQ